MKINESDFNHLVDATLEWVENYLDERDVDIDYETSAGILTLEFENGSKLIINRQAPVSQLWLAARSGGFHFDYDDEQKQWRWDKDGTTFCHILNQVCLEQGAFSSSDIDFCQE
ncbi:iron donor protein CyaY [Candidatus Venteria ishoeyi]|uniref:Iron-sulfur cluster assembly protein CyaY n=1 Tax=Candidatus Venteria ishoeyi TaxID=1899563 RepID=A0A1H6FDU4_9GAMM|nr:iron donor protein CyaY [Candidatus Venteria ishoeyi]MDM8545323.1 iron donor protein CyaY [Candidatus Venteria ishoeyi]SEH04502.1 frataxin-like protein [Candidatus Venteria ishoeyi]SEH07205.1 frataxin-like protein [Candidatus Venteria ishoeyi]